MAETYICKSIQSARLNLSPNYPPYLDDELWAGAYTSLAQFEEPDADTTDWKYKIIDIVLNMCIVPEEEKKNDLIIRANLNSWDEATVTENNMPVAQNVGEFHISADTAGWISLELSQIKTDWETASKVIQFGIRINATPYVNGEFCVYSSRAAEEYRPYAIITVYDSTPFCAPVTPKNAVVGTSTPVRFVWEYINEAPLATQKSYIVQFSPDGISWIDAVSGETADNYVDIAPGMLTADIRYWRVQVTSIRDMVSEWSAPASIAVVAAPSVAIISTTATPRPTVTWSADAQRGYQVQMGSHDSGPIYGTDTTYKCPAYLPDGPTEIRVRAVSQYGLWSQWAATTVNIANAPGTPALLTATATHRAALSWSGPEGAYTVLRDGREIAQVQGGAYVDELAIGRHAYQVRHALAGDYYTLSNEISVDMRCRYPMIAALDSLDWLALKLSTTATPAAGISRSQEVYYTHYSGRRLPLAETSGYTNVTLSFAAAFRSPAEAEGLLSLVGKAVCYKDPRGQLIIGVLEGLESEVGRMYSEYTGVIRATDEGAGL